MSAPDFDARAAQFSAELQIAANWKHNFFGAAYSTRIKAAIEYAEEAIARAKQMLADDGTPITQSTDPVPAKAGAGEEHQSCLSSATSSAGSSPTPSPADSGTSSRST